MTDTETKVWSRCRIRGRLKMTSPLILGDGTTRPGPPTDDDQATQIACVARAANGSAMIPGSSLKGVLRDYLRRRCRLTVESEVTDPVMNKIFGRGAQERGRSGSSPDSGQGGSVEFGFSYSRDPVPRDDRSTNREQAVAIDRVTGTASDRKLFTYDIVPENTIFDVTLTGFNLTEPELNVLCLALEGFNDQSDPVRLGSGSANHYGTAEWSELKIQLLGRQEIDSWLNSVKSEADYWAHAKSYVPNAIPTTLLHASRQLRIGIGLDFDGWFLVRDPLCGKEKRPIQKESDAYPRLTAQRHVLLPRRSFRGVFRSQVERIARTLNGDAGGDPHRSVEPGIIEALFGYSGGRAVVQCGPFVDPLEAMDVPAGTLPDEVQKGTRRGLFPREFVAIDRFTGGAADHLKFDCVAAWRPRLTGFITIDLDELRMRCRHVNQAAKRAVSPAAALGLLFLSLRDLYEGDVSFGAGASKGFGQCRAVYDASLSVTASEEIGRLLDLNVTELNAAVANAATHASPFLFDSALVRAIAELTISEARANLTQVVKGTR